MKIQDASFWVYKASGSSTKTLTKKAGRKGSGFDPIIYRQRIPNLSTYAALCDVCGFDLLVRDRYSGEEEIIEPPQ